MMVAFFSIFPFCGLIVGWIILLLYTHFVRKKNDTSDRWIEIIISNVHILVYS